MEIPKKLGELLWIELHAGFGIDEDDSFLTEKDIDNLTEFLESDKVGDALEIDSYTFGDLVDDFWLDWETINECSDTLEKDLKNLTSKNKAQELINRFLSVCSKKRKDTFLRLMESDPILQNLDLSAQGNNQISKSRTSDNNTSVKAPANTSNKPAAKNSTPSTKGAKNIRPTNVPMSDCKRHGSSLYEYVGKAKSIRLPDGIISIGDDAFFLNKKITTVVIPEGVKSIGHGAFYGCKSLKTIVLPSTLKKIEDKAFYDCKELTEVYIPEGCEKIGEYAFWWCDSLKDIYIPKSVNNIEGSIYTASIELELQGQKLTLHTTQGSAADKYANEHPTSIRVVYDYGANIGISEDQAKEAESSSKSGTQKKNSTKVSENDFKTVIVDNTWSIDIPEKYNYLNDKRYTAKASATPGNYLLQVHDGECDDFSITYCGDFSATVSEMSVDASFWNQRLEESLDAYCALKKVLMPRAEISYKNVANGYAVALLRNGFTIDAYTWDLIVLIKNGINKFYAGTITSPDNIESLVEKIVSSIKVLTDTSGVPSKITSKDSAPSTYGTTVATVSSPQKSRDLTELSDSEKRYQIKYMNQAKEFANLMEAALIDLGKTFKLFAKVWQNSMTKTKDPSTDVYTRKLMGFGSFHETEKAKSLFLESSQFKNVMAKIEISQNKLKDLKIRLKNPPARYPKLYAYIELAYNNFASLTQYVNNPTGMLADYNNKIVMLLNRIAENSDEAAAYTREITAQYGNE